MNAYNYNIYLMFWYNWRDVNKLEKHDLRLLKFNLFNFPIWVSQSATSICKCSFFYCAPCVGIFVCMQNGNKVGSIKRPIVCSSRSICSFLKNYISNRQNLLKIIYSIPTFRAIVYSFFLLKIYLQQFYLMY